MADTDTPSSPSTRSTAQQVVYWLILVSLVAALAVMGAWWLSEGIPVTPSTSFIFMFAAGGLWMTIYHLLILGIKRLVRNSVAQNDRAGP